MRIILIYLLARVELHRNSLNWVVPLFNFFKRPQISYLRTKSPNCESTATTKMNYEKDRAMGEICELLRTCDGGDLVVQQPHRCHLQLFGLLLPQYVGSIFPDSYPLHSIIVFTTIHQCHPVFHHKRV